MTRCLIADIDLILEVYRPRGKFVDHAAELRESRVARRIWARRHPNEKGPWTFRAAGKSAVPSIQRKSNSRFTNMYKSARFSSRGESIAQLSCTHACDAKKIYSAIRREGAASTKLPECAFPSKWLGSCVNLAPHEVSRRGNHRTFREKRACFLEQGQGWGWRKEVFICLAAILTNASWNSFKRYYRKSRE